MPNDCDFAGEFKLLFKPNRYKVYYGGRGSGKSWSFARILLIKAVQQPLRILCARELQSSIADSVHRLLQDQISALGLEEEFLVTKQAILGRNGSEFFFKGLRHNAAEIKSTEGIDICWVEEAQSVSEASWDLLIPTVRKEGSEIWISFNPAGIDDPTYQKFVVHPPDGALVRKVNFDKNPWFPDVLREEMEHCRRVDPDAYDNVWLGNPKVASDAQIFKGKYDCVEFEAPEKARFYHGADWGFANDPTALVRCWIRNDELYVDYEAVGYHVELDDTPALFDTVPTARKWPIIADSARPETISYMANRGFNIQPCCKWRGGIEDGISVMRSFKKIHVHPRCPNTLNEFKMYSYKQDHLTGEILPVILGCYDHCMDSIRYGLEAVIRARRTIRLSKGITDQMSRSKMIRNGFVALRRGIDGK